MPDYMPLLLEGAVMTVKLFAAAAALGFVVAVIAALSKISKFRPLRWLANIYIETFRGSSLLVQLFWFFYVLPLFGILLPAFEVGVLALALNTGSYGAEVVRGAILAVDRGQYDAAKALNMSRFTVMRRVIFPQAAVAMLPPWGNLLIELLKGTALVSLITIHDLTFKGKLVIDITFRMTEIFGILMVMYYAMSLFLNGGTRSAERWLRRGIPRGRLG